MLPKFQFGDEVRIVRNVRNDGTYPGVPTGTLLIRRGTTGVVINVGTFLQDALELGHGAEEPVPLLGRGVIEFHFVDLEQLQVLGLAVAIDEGLDGRIVVHLAQELLVPGQFIFIAGNDLQQLALELLGVAPVVHAFLERGGGKEEGEEHEDGWSNEVGHR